MLRKLTFLVLVLISCSGAGVRLEVDKNINVTYNPDKDVITVQFDAHKLKHSQYQLEIFKNSCIQRKMTVQKKALVTSSGIVESEFPGPYETGLYCIMLTPSNASGELQCRVPCQPVLQEIYVQSKAYLFRRQNMHVQRYPRGSPSETFSDQLDCREWNDSTSIDPHANYDDTYQITVTVTVEKPFQRCITRINITLWKDIVLCDSASGFILDRKTVDVPHDREAVAIFSDLKPGNYCIRMYTYHAKFCEGNCKAKFSEVLHLQSLSPPIAQHSTPNAGSDESSLTFVLVGCAVFTLLIVVGFVFFFKKLHIHFPIPTSDKGPTLVDLIEFAKKTVEKLEIVLVYSPDFEEHCGAVDSLFQLILESFKIQSVRYDRNEESQISVNLHSWVESVVEPQGNRVFLFIESEGAVLQEEGRKRSKLLRPGNEDCLDDIFPYALQLLKSDTRGCSDYKSVFVVKFKYTPEDLTLNFLVRNRRYVLPSHLFELYCDLLDLPKSSVQVRKEFKDTMTSQWQEEDLTYKIEEVSRIISSKPTIVKDCFVEQDLFTCV